jgi:hypothetical protein
MSSAAEHSKPRTARGLSARLNLPSGNSEENTDAAPLKKPRTARGLSARLSISDNCDDPDDVGVYSSRVSNLFSAVLCVPELPTLSADPVTVAG